MAKKNTTSENTAAAPASASCTGRAKYLSGPPEIDFSGRHWFKDVEQPMTDAEFGALEENPNAPQFSFVYTADAAEAPAHPEE